MNRNERITRAADYLWQGSLCVIKWQLAIGGGVTLKQWPRTALWRAIGTGTFSWAAWYFAGPHIHAWYFAAGILAVFGALLCVPEEKEPEPLMTEDETLLSLWQLIGPNKAVHLSMCALEWNCAMDEARGLIEAAGATIRRSVKVGGVVRTGVHRDDVPAPLRDDETHEWTVVPGERSTSTSTYVIKKGELGPEAWFQDPFNPARTHVIQLGKREDAA